MSLLLLACHGQRGVPVSKIAKGWEEQVCDCIASNTKSIGLDYYAVSDSVRQDLVLNDIIDPDFKQLENQLNTIRTNGYLSETRSYEHILYEQVGLKTIQYCVEIHTYKQDCEVQPHPLFKLFRELNNLRSLPTKGRSIRKELAEALLPYVQKNEAPSRLWVLVYTEFLYMLTDMNTSPRIDLPMLYNEAIDTSHTVSVSVMPSDSIYVVDTYTQLADLCERLSPYILDQKGIRFKNTRNTKYTRYLEVYNEVKACFAALRNRKSLEVFQKPYEDADAAQKRHIRNLIPLRIVETPIKN